MYSLEEEFVAPQLQQCSCTQPRYASLTAALDDSIVELGDGNKNQKNLYRLLSVVVCVWSVFLQNSFQIYTQSPSWIVVDHYDWLSTLNNHEKHIFI